MHRKKYLVVSSDNESNIYDMINKEIGGNESSRTVVGFKDWIESLMDKWKEFVEDFLDSGKTDENVKDTNRTAAEFIDDLIKSLFDSWGEYVDEFSGSDDREVGCCLGYKNR